MTNRVGLWIDHKQAVIVSLSGKGETVKKIESGAQRIEWRGSGRRRAADAAQYAQAEDQLDNQFMEHLKKYYARVTAELRKAESVLVFGPSEAKLELKRFIQRDKSLRPELLVEPADRMTERQIIARVRKHFK